jgi:hypothetical protein
LLNILEEKYLKECNLKEEVERFSKQVTLRKIDYKKLEELFPVNATYKILDDIFRSLDI